MAEKSFITVDGNEAAALVAHRDQRSHRDLPDHAGLADGRIRRCLVGEPDGRTSSASCRKSSRCRAKAVRRAPSTAHCRPGR